MTIDKIFDKFKEVSDSIRFHELVKEYRENKKLNNQDMIELDNLISMAAMVAPQKCQEKKHQREAGKYLKNNSYSPNLMVGGFG